MFWFFIVVFTMKNIVYSFETSLSELMMVLFEFTGKNILKTASTLKANNLSPFIYLFIKIFIEI